MANQKVFQIDTKGKCLLCLSNSINEGDHVKVAPSPTAFKFLLRYLKIDIMKFCHFSSSAFCPPPSSPDCNVSVELCNRCYSLTTQFHQLFQEFDRIRMELDNYAGKLHDAIEEGDKDVERVREYRNLVKPPEECFIHPVDALNASIAESLRSETMVKCSKRMSFSTPRIHLIPDETVPAKGQQFCTKPEPHLESDNEDDVIENDIIMDPQSEAQIPSTPTAEAEEIGAIGACEVSFLEVEHDLPEPDPLELSDTVGMTTTRPTTPEENEDSDIANDELFQALEEPRKNSHTISRRGYAPVHCPHCHIRLTSKPKLRVHLISIHTFLHFFNRLPPGTTEEQLDSAIKVTLGERIVIRSPDGKRFCGCPMCRKPIRDTYQLKGHILTTHFDEVLSNYYRSIEQENTQSNSVIRESAEVETIEVDCDDYTSSPPPPARDPLEVDLV